jgi:hypothetical protein
VGLRFCFSPWLYQNGNLEQRIYVSKPDRNAISRICKYWKSLLREGDRARDGVCRVLGTAARREEDEDQSKNIANPNLSLAIHSLAARTNSYRCARYTGQHNTSVSAVAVLDSSGLTLYHNVFAAFPVRYELFKGIAVRQFTLGEKRPGEFAEWQEVV